LLQNEIPEHDTWLRLVQAGLYRNSALALASRIITALATLCLVPFIILRLGIAGYGIWESIVSFGIILFILQNVISNTLLWWMSQAYGRGDHETISRSAGIGLTSLGLFFFRNGPRGLASP
jgi:O-antigen/teichoic acid export membrane protein